LGEPLTKRRCSGHAAPETQPERDVNREGRKRAEKGQKMAEGRNASVVYLVISGC
jgi:hypothetical protein